VLVRLLWLAHVDLDVAIDDQRRFDPAPRRASDIRWIATTAGVARFQIAAIGNDDVVGLLSHEVGLAYAAWQAGAAAYRDAELPPPSERDGSIAAIYLGLGVLATNAALEGHGGLGLAAAIYLLAIQAVLRDEPIAATRPCASGIPHLVGPWPLAPHRERSRRTEIDLHAPRAAVRDPAPPPVAARQSLSRLSVPACAPADPHLQHPRRRGTWRSPAPAQRMRWRSASPCRCPRAGRRRSAWRGSSGGATTSARAVCIAPHRPPAAPAAAPLIAGRVASTAEMDLLELSRRRQRSAGPRRLHATGAPTVILARKRVIRPARTATDRSHAHVQTHHSCPSSRRRRALPAAAGSPPTLPAQPAATTSSAARRPPTARSRQHHRDASDGCTLKVAGSSKALGSGMTCGSAAAAVLPPALAPQSRR
jgi:hypothetical protein